MAKLVIFILILFSANVIAMPLGNSAWIYDKKSEWIEQIKSFNEHVSPTNRINYLFPNAASVHVDQKNEKLIIDYDKSVTQYYNSSLKNIKILPNLSFWVARSNFKNWPEEKYKLSADVIAAIINTDRNAHGVFLDLESYSPNMLPFY